MVTCLAPPGSDSVCLETAAGDICSFDQVCPIRERTIELNRLLLKFFRSREDRLKHRIGVEHGLQ